MTIAQGEKNLIKSQLTCAVLCITCLAIAFGGISKRFEWVLGSLFSSPCSLGYLCRTLQSRGGGGGGGGGGGREGRRENSSARLT